MLIYLVRQTLRNRLRFASKHINSNARELTANIGKNTQKRFFRIARTTDLQNIALLNLKEGCNEFFIPLVNIVIAVIVWMGIVEARGKPSWLGILMLIPVVNIIIPGFLAFTE